MQNCFKLKICLTFVNKNLSELFFISMIKYSWGVKYAYTRQFFVKQNKYAR